MTNPIGPSTTTQPETDRPASPGRGRGLWWKVPLLLILVLLLLSGLLLSLLSPILTHAANRYLPGLLQTEVSLDQAKIRLMRGTAGLRGLRIGQPKGFGTNALLELDRIDVQVDLGSLLARDPLAIRSLDVEGLRAHVIRNTNRVLNVQQLAPPPKQAAPTSEAEAAEATLPEEQVAAPIGILVENLTVTDLAINYEDGALVENETISFTLRDLSLDMGQLRLFTDEVGSPSPVRLSFVLDQGDHPPARFGVLARLGAVGTGVPDVIAQGKLTGFMFDTLGPLVPTGARSGVGGDGGDVALGLALQATAMDLRGAVRTDQGHSYPTHVRGPFASPDINVGPIAAAVAMRFSGGAVNLTKNVTGAATDLAKGATKGVEELGKGATKTVGAVGSGLLGATKGLMTGNLEQAGAGMKKASVGAVGDMVDGVKEAEGAVVESSKESKESATGGKRNTDWLAEIENRHAGDMEAAKEALEAMAWPPVIDIEQPAPGSPTDADAASEPEVH